MFSRRAFSRTITVGETGAGPEGLLVSPLTGAACVWYKVKAESWQAHADLHHRETVCLLSKGQFFLVRGEPAPQLVNADIIRALDPPVHTISETVQGKRPPTRDEAPLLFTLADRGLLPASALRRRAHLLDELVWQTTESYLPPGIPVTAHGRLDRRSILRHSLLTGSALLPHPRAE